jgi:TonB-linked SusC/RagA family outer membrane protein
MTRWLVVGGTLGTLALALPAAGARGQGTPGGAGRVTGTVTSTESGQPLVGTTVTVVGTRQGAVTRADGQYTITGVPPGSYQVRAAMIGYAPATQTVAVAAGGAATANFQLARQALQLDAVVSVGYGTQSRRDVTGSVASVRGSEIAQIPTPNAVDAIRGRVPGVDIAPTSNAPGAALQVRVRGTRSLTASNDPLYVLDGIPLSGGLQDINPNDIASLEVLKDASATAIYGSRGANGVVLITTKQGSRQGGTRISYDGYVGEQRILNRVRMMTGEEFAEYRREAFRTVGRYTNDADVFFPSELQMLQSGQETDWQSLVLRPGLQSSNQLSVTGGNERTRFALSGELFGQDAITRGQGFGRRSLRLNFDHQPTGRLSLGASSLLSRATQDLGRNNGLISEALLNSPLGPARDSAGALLFKPTPDGQRVNPLSDVANFLDENARTRAFATLFAEYRPAKGLSLRTNFGPDLSFVRSGRFRGSQTFDRQGGTADARIQEDRTFAYTLDNILTYRRDVGRTDKVDVTLLYGIQSQRFDEHDTEVSGLPYEHQRTYNLGSAGRVENVASRLEEWTLQSYMARVNYDLRGRYLLTVTGRADGSSRLAPGQKYGLFPSVAVGWRASDERFLRDRGWFDELKVRASFGRTGNTGINPYQTQGSLGRTTYAFGDAAAYGFRPAVLPNPNLKWETTTQVDAGVDFSVLKNRVSGTVDFYRSRTNDLLLQRLLPPTTGFNQILENVGATSNTGLEVGLTTVNVERPGRGGFRWSTTANWSTNRNRIVALSGGGNDVGSRRFVGQPISVWYDLQFAGIWQLADSLEARRYGRTPGQIRVVDQNDDGRITQDADRVVLGSPFPDWIGSLSNRLDWKGFDLNVLATARQGFMLNSWFHSSLNQLFGRYNNLKVDYWTPTNPSNTNPRPNRDQESPLNGGARAYRDGSFVRVRNVTLGYAIPPRLVGRVGAQSARLYFTAQDPFIFTKYDGFDPEAGSGNVNADGNVDGAATPNFRTLLVGLNLGF